jgi:hypothetical protein
MQCGLHTPSEHSASNKQVMCNHLSFGILMRARIDAVFQPLHARLMPQQRTATSVKKQATCHTSGCRCTYESSLSVTCVSSARARAAALRSMATILHDTLITKGSRACTRRIRPVVLLQVRGQVHQQLGVVLVGNCLARNSCFKVTELDAVAPGAPHA